MTILGFWRRPTNTGFAFRIEHRKWNRGRNGLHQLGQPVAPSVPFPVFNPEGEPGTDKVRNITFVFKQVQQPYPRRRNKKPSRPNFVPPFSGKFANRIDFPLMSHGSASRIVVVWERNEVRKEGRTEGREGEEIPVSGSSMTQRLRDSARTCAQTRSPSPRSTQSGQES